MLLPVVYMYTFPLLYHVTAGVFEVIHLTPQPAHTNRAVNRQAHRRPAQIHQKNIQSQLLKTISIILL